MLKFIQSTFIVLALYTSCKAQNFIDTIITKKVDTIICQITLINNNNIFYNYPIKNTKTESAYISRSKVSQFILNNKDADLMTEKPKNDSAIILNSSIDTLFLKGQSDALRFYDYYNVAGTGTFFISLLSPGLGLIPAIGCSTTPVKDKHLNYPNTIFAKNPYYRKGYEQKALKIKQGKVWKNWGVAFGINVLAVAIIISSNGKFP